ncbi:inactive tetrahydrocannabinolic acid synthase, partial [Cladorrhinum sp. PSN259]
MQSLPLFLLLAIQVPCPVWSKPIESELTEQDAQAFPSLRFAHPNLARNPSLPRCKSFPGDASWPTESDWSRLNASLGGALLKPRPPASVCYPTSPNFNNASCNFLFTSASQSTFYFDDPVTVLGEWPQGLTCPRSRNPTGNCTQGGFPEYVVNATTPKHVQAAVNFARNNNIRLIIKNTGHDTSGRNIGAGSLSVFTHFLKGFEFLPNYEQPGGNYQGPAAHVGSGLQVWEAFRQAERYNVTLTAASCLTVGSYGGWISGGGHSPLSSKYGLGVDQVLELKVVTADGRYLTANPEENEDLFFALRGGGGSTYGVITSAIVKAHPPINLTIASFNFALGTTPTNGPSSNPTITNSTAFWLGFNAVYAFGIPVVDAGGYLWTNGLPQGPGFAMQVQVQMPGKTPAEAAGFVQPLVDELNGLGIPVTISVPTTRLYSSQTGGVGTAPGPGGYLASRLFPRKAYKDPALFSAAMAAVKKIIEEGYTFHGLNMAPTLKVAEFPSIPGVNPVWRESVMHADVFAFSQISMGTATDAEVLAAHERMNSLMEPLKAATPGGGAYLNEADAAEPDWQQSFYGANYERLQSVKRGRDPWGVFWAPTTPGSETWKVEGEGGLLWRQNGRLCRVN